MSQVVTTELVIDARPAEVGARDYARAMDKASAAADKARGAEAKLQEKIDESRGVQSRAATLVAERSNAYERLRAKIDPVVALEQRMARATNDADRAVRSGQATQAQATATLEAYRLKQQQLLGILPKVAAANENVATKARAGWAALTEQGVAQGKAVQLAERQAAAWRALSAQGAAQAQALAGLKGANDNVTASLAAQAGQVGALFPGYAKLIALVGSLGAAHAASKFVETVTSFQAIDASLKAATGSTEAAQSALAFVRAESDRLGLSLGSTAKDFASFAASTRGTELEGEKARKVFSAIAEAGTVLGLSADDMSGALLALSQMASKGTVSSEELRGQLGERLPGAFNIAAKAMGVTTAELGKMLEQGQVLASDFLPKFADEMHRVFGPEAANASKNLQANLNRLQTAILDLFLAAGKGGLTEALNDAVRQATGFLKSSQDMAGSAGGALASGLRAAGAAFQFLRDNSTAAGVALAAVLALRFGPSVIEIVAAVARAVAMMGVYDVATRQLVVSQTAAVASSRALSIAMGAIGGPIGLALTAAAAGVAYLVLRQDEGTKAAQTQAAALRTLDEALVQNKGSLIGASEETKRLAAEQLAAAQAAVDAARKRLAETEKKAADTSPEVGVAGFEAYYASADRAAEASFQLGAAQADLDDKSRRLSATTNLVAGNLTVADAAVLGFGSSVSQSAAQVDAAIPSMIKYGDAMAKLIAMVPELQQAVDTQNKVAAAKAALDAAITSSGEAHLRGEISFKQMRESGDKAREVYKLATEEVTGFTAASKKLDTEARGASIAAMDARAGAIAKLKDEHAALVQTYKEGNATQMTAEQRTELVSRAEAVLAQKVANTNKEFDEREAKKAGATATKEAAKAAREAAREFDGFEKQAEAAFKKLFPEDALRKKGQELQALLDKYEERLAKIDPRLVESIKTEIKLNLEGKEVESVKHKANDLSSEMSQTFRGVFDDMFTNAGKGLDGLLDSITKGFSRIGSRLVEKNLIEPLFNGKGGEGGSSSGSFLGFSLSDIRSTFRDGFGDGFDDTFGPLLEPAKNSKGESMGFGSSKLGAGLTAGLAGASIGYSTQNPLIGAVGGGLAGFAAGAAAGGTMGPIGAVIGAGAGLIGGLLGKAQAKKAAEKRVREQLEAFKQAYREAEPEIKKLEATFRGESVGNVGGQIDAAFQQAVAANKTASQAQDQPRADAIMKDFEQYAVRLRDQFMFAFEGTLSEVSKGFGTSGPFAAANAAIAALGESLKAFVADSMKLPEAESNSARARAAAQQAALAALDPPKALSDAQQRLAAIQGTAAGLGRVLQDLGMSATDAAAAIKDRTAVAMKALRAEFSADLKAKTNSAQGKEYLNEVADLVREREGLLADAKAIGAGTADVSAYFKASAQKIIDGSELTGAAFDALVKQFPALKGAVVEFGQAVDSAAAKAAAAARATGYADRLFAAGNDTSTLSGALAAQERKAVADRLAEQAAGGQKMAELEKALGAEQAAIRRQFAEQAAAAEAAARDAGQRRVVAAEDRIFAARNDTSTLTGKLAEIDRRHAQERLAETDADGRAMAKLLEAQSAERLKIVREAGEAEIAARKAALAEAQTFLDGASKNIRTYLDGLKAGPQTNLSPGARLKEAQAQFDAQLKLAKGGDRDALSSITTYADRLLDAGKGQYASGKGYQDILGSVTKQLGALPKQVSAEQFIVDAIKTQTTALQTAIGTGSAAETAKALSGSFTKLDDNTNGLLSQKEFLKALGPKATVAEQQAALAVFREIDLNGDGQLSKLELARAQLKGAIEANSPALIQKALSGDFTKLDTSANGLLSPEEFLAGLGPLATSEEQAAAMEWFKSIDENGDGQLSKLELMRGQLVTALKVDTPAAMAAAIKTNFPKLDINKDGLLSTKEYLSGLGPLASKQEQQAALQIFKSIDLDGDGQISKLELVRAQLKGAIEANAPSFIQKALSADFTKLDTNTNKLLTPAEFVAGLGPLATAADQAAALEWFKAIDENGDGLLSKTELMRGQLVTALTVGGPQAMATAIKTNFPKLDINKDGLLSSKEFLTGLGPLASKAEQQAALTVFKAIDLDGDGQISKLEALRTSLGSNLTGINDVTKAVKDSFTKLDKDGSGGLSLKEFKSAFGPLATKADQKLAEAYFKEIDADGDKIITKMELTTKDLLDGIKKNSPTDIASALKKNFPTIDVNSDGGITYDEMVKALGPKATKADQDAAKKIFDNIDADGDKVITKAEAIRADLLTQLKLNDPAKMGAALASSFADIDKNKDKEISRSEYLASLGKITAAQKSEAEKLFAQMDRDKSGGLSQFEVVGWAIVDAVKANSASKFAEALEGNFSTLNTTVDGVLDKDELAAAIKNLATTAEQKSATDWIKKIDSNGNGQLTQAELAAGRLFDLKGLTSTTTKAVTDVKNSTDTVKSSTDNSKDATNKATLAIKDVEKATSAINQFNGVYQQSFSYHLKLMERVVNNVWAANVKSGAQRFAEGGLIRGAGTGTSDSIPIWASDGEFMMRAAATRAIGLTTLRAMNDNPGMVPAVPMPVMGAGLDVGAIVAAIRSLEAEVRALKAENKAGQEMQARVTKAGADKVAGKVEETTDEVAGSRDDNRKAAAPMRAGRGEPVKSAA